MIFLKMIYLFYAQHSAYLLKQHYFSFAILSHPYQPENGNVLATFWKIHPKWCHNDDFLDQSNIMSMMGSQITGASIGYSAMCSGVAPRQ